MKKYVVNKIVWLFLVVALVIGGLVLDVCHWSVDAIIISILSLSIIVCDRDILLLPIDLMIGFKTEIVYFNSVYWIYDYEMLPNKFKKKYCKCKVYDKYNREIIVTLPVYKTKEEIAKISDFYLKNPEIRLTYYPLSKIVVSWTNQNNDRADQSGDVSVIDG